LRPVAGRIVPLALPSQCNRKLESCALELINVDAAEEEKANSICLFL
jgi:hypothetical protein